MHIFVINLPEAAARRVAIESQLNVLGLRYEIIPGIKGKNLSPEERVRHYDETRFVRNVGRPIDPGELGCSLSHIAIYRRIKERNISHALILEDDAWLNPNLPQLLHAIEQKYASEEGNVFLLSWPTRISNINYQILWSYYRLAKVHSAICTHAYVVTNTAAAALLKALYPVCHVPDPWNWLLRHRIVTLQAVVPPCITVDMSHNSFIGMPETGKYSVIARMKHKLWRAWWTAVDYAEALTHRIGKMTGK